MPSMNFQLTKRQQEIMELLILGKRADGIALELHISINTVRRHLSLIYRHFGVTSQAQAIAIFFSAQKKQTPPAKSFVEETKLSEREQGVMALYQKGLGPKQIAAILSLAPSTVREYARRARNKIDAKTTQ
ncbi:MAG TPA: LuxR C-terminal-related transcriptional regulator [Candidatus Aquicultor sp.]